MIGDRLARPPVTAGDVRIDEDFVRAAPQIFGPAQVGDHRRDRVRTSDPEGAHESKMAESPKVFGRLLPVELDNPEPDSIGQGRHLVGRAVDEQADRLGRAWKGGHNLGRQRGIDTTG